MRSKKISFHIPWPLYEEVQRQCRAAHMKNVGRFFIALAIDEMMRERRTDLCRAIANADPEDQDALVEILMNLPKQREEYLRVFLERNRNQPSNA